MCLIQQAMKNIKVTFLGTATSIGVPVVACGCAVCQSTDTRDKRLRSSVLVEVDDLKLVIDCGPDFRQQMLSQNISNIDGILLTHEHRDHVGGLDDVRGFNLSLSKAIPIYCEQRVEKNLKKDFSYIFAEHKYKGIPELSITNIGTKPFSIKDTIITPIRVMHHKLEILGFRIGDFAYITDAKYIAPEELAKLDGVSVLVINALRKRPHFSHFSLDEALEVIGQIKPKRSYLTHISHALGKHAEVQLELPANVYLAYDRLIVEE